MITYKYTTSVENNNKLIAIWEDGELLSEFLTNQGVREIIEGLREAKENAVDENDLKELIEKELIDELESELYNSDDEYWLESLKNLLEDCWGDYKLGNSTITAYEIWDKCSSETDKRVWMSDHISYEVEELFDRL